MAKVSMSDIKSAKPEPKTEAPEAGETRLVTGEDAAKVRKHAHNRAVKPPSLSIGHSIGELGGTFGVGNFVLDKAVSLGKEIEVILLDHPQICLVEDAEYGGDALPDIVFARSTNPNDIASAEEIVLEKGGVLRKEDSEDGHPWYRMGANVIVLIKAPGGTSEEERGLFPYSIGGHDYAAAVWYIRKSAYRPAVASGFGRSRLWLKDKPFGATWRVRTKMETFKKNTYPVPMATLLNKLDPDKDGAFLAELAELAATFAAPSED